MESNPNENHAGGGVMPIVIYVAGTILVLVLIKVYFF